MGRDSVTRWSGMLAAVAVAGCAAMGMPKVVPGKSSEADVVAAMGKPAMELKRPNGDRLLYYTYYPWGRKVTVATLGADGVLRGLEPRLTSDNIYSIKQGMKEQEVRELLGPPREISRLPIQDLVVWEYPWMKSSTEKRILWVHFSRDGVVAKIVEMHDEVAEPSTD